MDNTQINYKVRFSDIFKTLFSMISGGESLKNMNEKDIEKRIQEIQNVEKDIGASDRIENLQKQILTYSTKSKRVARSTKLENANIKPSTKRKNIVSIESKKEDKIQEI